MIEMLIYYNTLPVVLGIFFGALAFGIFIVPFVLSAVFGGKGLRDW